MKKRFIKKQMDIAAQIHELLENEGWTQKKLSEESGVPEQILSNIRSGHANPTLETLVKIEEALDANIIVAPKFYKKALNRNGFTITKRSIGEKFHLDIEGWLTEKKYFESRKQSRSFAVTGYTESYNMSAQDLNKDVDLKAA